MALSHIAPGERIDLQGSTVVVAVPLYGAHDLFVRCLSSLLKHTPESAPILIADDHGPDPASEAWVRELDEAGRLEHRVIWMRNSENLGFVGNCNLAIHAADRADIVLVNSDVEVAEGWLQGLTDAAHSDTLVATATALTNHGTIVSVPYRNRPQSAFPQHITFDQAAAAVRQHSERIRPELPTAIGHCFYIRRSALDLVGAFDEAFAPGYGEEADFSQRCIAYGLRHVAADDVLVYHRGQASFGIDGGRHPRQDAHEEILKNRYRYYEASVEMAIEDEVSPLARAITLASQALLGSRITIDGTCLGPTMTGTQVHTLELLAALNRTNVLKLRVVVPDDLGEEAALYLAAHPEITQIAVSEVRQQPVELDDLVHRPFQINSPDDLSMLGRLGNRILITHQDLIAYHNPTYFPSAKHWQKHRQSTRESLALADHIVFFSQHARTDALREELVPSIRSSVVHIGVNHQAVHPTKDTEPVAGHPELTDDPFLLILGTDFRHKNRLFGLRVFERLLHTHGWQGRVVLAGPSVSYGSSLGDEAAWLASRPEIEERVITLPAIGEPTKNWLLANAAAVLYPTTYEGFGLLPFEAAQAGTPCLFAHVTSIADLLESVPAALVPWDADISAANCAAILTDGAAAQANVDAILAVAEHLSWDATASELVEIYHRTITERGRDSRNFVGDSLVIDARYWGLRNDIGPTGLSLVDPDEPLLPIPAQRTIAGLTRRSATRRPFLGLLSLLQRLTPNGRQGLDAARPSDTDGEAAA